MTEGLPEVGDYVQAKCENETTEERRVFEGLIASVENGMARFVGETCDTTPWVVYTWRKLIPREFEYVRRRMGVLA
jgi:hypothetical protein